jgi:hypothetical protein
MQVSRCHVCLCLPSVGYVLCFPTWYVFIGHTASCLPIGIDLVAISNNNNKIRINKITDNKGKALNVHLSQTAM